MIENDEEAKTSQSRIIRFEWSDSIQKFTSQDKNLNNLTSNHKEKITRLVKKIESKSGIKRDSCLLFFLAFTLATLTGFAISFILIASSKSQHGGVMIILTCLLVFFGFVGYQFHRGTQLTRVNHYFIKYSKSIEGALSPIGFSIVHSFRFGKKLFNYF